MIKVKRTGPALILVLIILSIVVGIALYSMSTMKVETEEKKDMQAAAGTKKETPSQKPSPTPGFAYNPILKVSRPSGSVFAPTPTPAPEDRGLTTKLHDVLLKLR